MRIKKEFLIVIIICAGLSLAAHQEWRPIGQMMDWKARNNSRAEQTSTLLEGYEYYDHTDGLEPLLTVDFLKGKHFWNPQIAIWLEDSTGKYIETLLVTTSAARGLFYSGRTASNFKESDSEKKSQREPTRRVDALPYWSHKRGHRYSDGFHSPPPHEPLPDAVSGATPTRNFYFTSGADAINALNSFRIQLEVNVAFDENEYFSEYDFPEDSQYHGGTGLLGQPSLVYSAIIKKSDRNRYTIMTLTGRGHHSGATGDLFEDLNTITTARYIVERIVVGVQERWYDTKE